ncbi:hypothetical protein [Streptomyces sp. PD-S100-1]|uniref:hypothetical protein n=1 Tax=Streptomyces sp. PD-S100-1 TaxID=3394351 RepID=UPI0039BD1829
MTEQEFDLPPRAPSSVVAERNRLADEVCQELALAGLPVHRGDLDGSSQDRPGADVHVTPFIEGGVYVDWVTDAAFRDAALEIFAKGIDYSDPPQIVRHHKTIHDSMRSAILRILDSAGFQAEEPDRHAHGSLIQVKGRRN